MVGGGEQRAMGDLVAELDEKRFVGRRGALAEVQRALDGTSDTRIVHVHGPGGVGKSALLRAAGRLGERSAWPVVRLDGRLIPPVPDLLDAALSAVGDARGPVLVLLDELDELASVHLELRRLVLERLPAAAVLVTAGRRAPGSTWFEQGLDRLTTTIALRPLDVGESRDLLARSGVVDPGEAEAIVGWSGGFPLALALAADVRASDPGRPLAIDRTAAPGEHLDDLLVARLGGDELQGVDPDVLDVAAIAPAVDARLLGAVLPGRATRAGLTALRSCRLAEPIGPRVTLHRLARSALRSRLKETDPDRYRTLVLRIATHLRERADGDGGRTLTELAALIENAEVRLSFDVSTTHYADHAREGDAEAFSAALGGAEPAWAQRVARWIAERPQQVVVVRRMTGEAAALAIAFTASSVPEWALDSIEVGPALERARQHGHLDSTVFLQDVTMLEAPDDPAIAAEIVRVGNAGALVASGLLSPRCASITCTPDAVPPLASVGYVEIAELRRGDDDRELTTIVCDFGPAGMVGRAHELIRLEQQDESTPAAEGQRWLVPALRGFQDDEALRALDRGTANEVRVAVRAALARAFGDGATDRDLRRALERTYLDPDGGHGVAQRELFMSRSSFYRFLQRARAQLVERAGATVGERGGPGSG